MARSASTLELRIPPVAVVLLAAALMWLLATAVAGLRAPLPGRLGIAIALASAGFGVALAGVTAFRRAHTTVNPMTPDASSSVVTTGIYRHTRNPMYLGMLLVLLAWCVALGNAAALAGPVAFILYMDRFQIAPEERALQAKFGDPYAAYLRQVRRWL